MRAYVCTRPYVCIRTLARACVCSCARTRVRACVHRHFFSKDVTFYKQDESINKEMDETFDIINWVSTGIVTIEYFLRIYAMGEAKDDEVVINIYKYLSICHKDLRIHGRYADGPKWISLNLSNGYLSISLFRYPP